MTNWKFVVNYHDNKIQLYTDDKQYIEIEIVRDDDKQLERLLPKLVKELIREEE